MHCASKEESRYYLNGVFVQPGAGFMRFTATDGIRLASLKVTSGVPDGAVFEPVIVPRQVLRDYVKFLERADGPVVMSIDSNRLELSAGAETHITKLIDGSFPDYERVIPKGPFTRLTVPVSDLKSAIGVALTACHDKSRAVRFDPQEGVLTCSSRTDSQYSEAAVEAVDVEPGEPFGLNGGYVLEALDALRGEDVEICLSDPASPVLFSTGDELRQVVMPLRV
jgi:DNA polymerase-3 subunit beta